MNGSPYLNALAQFGVGSAHPGGVASTKELFQNERITDQDKILDVGCGTGITSAYLANTFHCEVHAIDIHPIMLEKAKSRMHRHNLNVKVKKASIEKLPYNESVFDYVISESVLSFVNIEKALAEIYSVLTNTGTVLINELCVTQTLSKEEENEIQSFYHFSKLNTEEEWCMYLKKAGFTQIERVEMGEDFEEGGESEFELSERISQELFDLLIVHEQLVNKFQSKLGYITLRCKK